jgi:hypothetical protein
MSLVLRRKMGRWTLVAATAAVLCAAPSVVASLPVHSSQLSASQLRQRIQKSTAQPYTGFAQTRGSLGLPDLPVLGDVTKLLSGTTDIRAWYRAPDANRVDVIDTVGERDVYESPDGTYTWDYGQQQLTEVVGDEPVRLPRAGDLLPPDLARRVLSMDTVDTPVSLPARRIAGIDAAGIRLRPADPATTVGQVDIWADPDTGLPLRVEVTARGGVQPVLISWFVNVDLHAPDTSQVTPPISPDNQVARTASPDILRAIGNLGNFPLPSNLAGYAKRPQQLDLSGGVTFNTGTGTFTFNPTPQPVLPGVGEYGTGLSTFVVLPLPRNVGSSAIDSVTKAGGTPVTERRGRAVLIQIPLLNVLIEQVGRRRTYLLAGFVDHTTLEQAATELAEQPRPTFR